MVGALARWALARCVRCMSPGSRSPDDRSGPRTGPGGPSYLLKWKMSVIYLRGIAVVSVSVEPRFRDDGNPSYTPNCTESPLKGPPMDNPVLPFDFYTCRLKPKPYTLYISETLNPMMSEGLLLLKVAGGRSLGRHPGAAATPGAKV